MVKLGENLTAAPIELPLEIFFDDRKVLCNTYGCDSTLRTVRTGSLQLLNAAYCPWCGQRYCLESCTFDGDTILEALQMGLV